MSLSTGPILAAGALTMANQSVFNSEPVDWRVPVATGLAALGFSALENAAPKAAQMLAWTVLATVLLTRTKADVPSPVESARSWWNSGSKGSSAT